VQAIPNARTGKSREISEPGRGRVASNHRALDPRKAAALAELNSYLRFANRRSCSFSLTNARVEAFYFISSRLHKFGDVMPALISKVGTTLSQFSRQKRTHWRPRVISKATVISCLKLLNLARGNKIRCTLMMTQLIGTNEQFEGLVAAARPRPSGTRRC